MTNSPKPAIEVSDLSFAYGEEEVLSSVTFDVAKNTLCALVGPNGSGKSTLVKCLTGLLKGFSGTAKVNCSHEHKSHSIGYVPQRLFISERVPVSVFEAVSTGRILGSRKWFRLNRDDKNIIEHSIDSVGLSSHINCRIDELSGGQQQRLLIAKALASEPEVLILDEPTAGVDSQSQELFRSVISHTIEEHDTTVFLVSHELSAVADVVDQILVLKKSILFDGTPKELSKHGVSLGLHEHDLPFWLERFQTEDLEGAK
jgi:zinc transport system ATP-binding protein